MKPKLEKASWGGGGGGGKQLLQSNIIIYKNYLGPWGKFHGEGRKEGGSYLVQPPPPPHKDHVNCTAKYMAVGSRLW